MTHCMCTADSVVGWITLTFLGRGSVVLAQRRGAGRQGVIATGVVRLDPRSLEFWEDQRGKQGPSQERPAAGSEQCAAYG